jgi:hypothetical protein
LLPVYAGAEIYTTPEGYKFEVNLILGKSEFMLGEPVYMDFEVKNLSDEDLGIVEGGDYRNLFGRPESFSVRVIDANGALVPKPDARFNMGGLSGFFKIPAMNKRITRLYLPHWATFEKTGSYTIFCEKNLIVRRYEKDNSAFYHSTGTPVKVSAKIKVVHPNAQKMGEIIDTLGGKMVAGDETAKKLLPFVEDRRVIKYFAETIRKDVWVMRALAKFNDDEALEAILSRKDDAEDEVRRNVSVALSLSVHPQATGHLLAMRHDRFFPIRLDVVHFLGKTKTEEATRILKEMTQDENDWVRNESKRYLQERGEKLQ